MPINISINIKMDVPSNIIVLGKSTYIKDRYGTPVILLKYCDFLLLPSNKMALNTISDQFLI
jgi:hypothetical protein